MVTRKRLLTSLVTIALISMCLACSEDGNGSCPGEMGDSYFILTVDNFTDTAFNILLNGRTVGSLGAYKGRNSDNESQPGHVNLAEFPVCVGHVFDANGTEGGDLDQQFCTTQEILGCDLADFCEFQLGICKEITEAGCITSDGSPVNYTTPISSTAGACNCPTGLEKC